MTKKELEDLTSLPVAGRTHNKEETFARLADPICYVAKEDVTS